MSKKKKFDVWLIITLAIFVGYILFMGYPLFTMLIKSIFNKETGEVTLEYFTKFFSKKYYYGTIINSFAVTITVTVLSVLIATPLAYIMATVKIKFDGLIRILILISSVSAPFIGAYSWILLLGRSGVITKFIKATFGITPPSIYVFQGIVLALTLQLVPLIFMYVAGALKNVDNSIVEAAESMGCTGVKKVIKIIIPLIMPTILAGALLVFMRAFADFGTPMLIGEGYRTIPVLIFNEFISEMGGEDAFAAAISVMVVVFATLVFVVQNYIANKNAFSTSSLRPIEPKKEKGLRNILAHGFIYLFIIIALLPQAYVIYTSFLNTNGKIFVEGYSLNSYREALSKAGDSIFNTFFLAVISIVVITFIAVLVAYVTIRKKNFLTKILDISTMFPYIVPGSIMGIALLVTFNKPPLLLSGTATILVISFVIRRLPYTIRSSSAILHQISISTEEAGISLGASSLKTFFVITLPCMLSGVVSGAILSWLGILTELATSILLYTVPTRTLTIAIYSEVLRGEYGTAAALSSILSGITVISLLIFFKLTGKKEITM